MIDQAKINSVGKAVEVRNLMRPALFGLSRGRWAGVDLVACDDRVDLVLFTETQVPLFSKEEIEDGTYKNAELFYERVNNATQKEP